MTISTKMYATALFEIGEKKPLAFLSELEGFSDILKSDQKVNEYFLKTYSQFDVVRDILAKEFTLPFINFLEIIYENRVFRDLDNITSNYTQILVEHNLITIVKVVSAKELSKENKQEIINMVKSKYKAPMEIAYAIDKSLMAGFVLRVNNDIYDTSLKSKLDQIKNLEV